MLELDEKLRVDPVMVVVEAPAAIEDEDLTMVVKLDPTVIGEAIIVE